jgi:hypothetical protein
VPFENKHISSLSYFAKYVGCCQGTTPFDAIIQILHETVISLLICDIGVVRAQHPTGYDILKYFLYKITFY